MTSLREISCKYEDQITSCGGKGLSNMMYICIYLVFKAFQKGSFVNQNNFKNVVQNASVEATNNFDKI